MKCWLTPLLLCGALSSSAAEWGVKDERLEEYFRGQTRAIAQRTAEELRSADWAGRREAERAKLADMLGLSPMPARTELRPVVTGKTDHADFTVERLYFQSMPRLYVTANLYVPKKVTGPAPAILYVCGHGNIKKEGVSYGAKAFYQHHPAWFARNGYVCLIIDTLQLGEIEGTHHGLHRENMWWWASRGYTPAGVEAWNCMRAIDYLVSRPEVDRERIGMTGRSGGGAYTWWTAALDERVKVAIPVAGITDLEDHVVNHCVEGHCDCMYFVNTHRWDFAKVAALVSPRTLVIGNTDKDYIFPLDGVNRIHSLVRQVYRQQGLADKHLGLVITEGPHKDTQELQVAAFRAFNRHFKKDEGPAEPVATKLFEDVELLRVYSKEHPAPAEQINTKIHESFVPVAVPPKVPESKEAWEKQRDEWMAGLREKVFAGWPTDVPEGRPRQIFSAPTAGLTLRVIEFLSQEPFRLRIYLLTPPEPKAVTLRVVDERDWPKLTAALAMAFADALQGEAPAAPDAAGYAELSGRIKATGHGLAFVAVRGTGATSWARAATTREEQAREDRRRTHILRRFYLLGQTLDGMRVYDVRRAVQTLRSELNLPVSLEASGRSAVLAVYASLFEEVGSLSLHEPPASHREGPDLLNVLRVLDTPVAVALAAERCEVHLRAKNPDDWQYALEVARTLDWGAGRLKVWKSEKSVAAAQE